MKKQINTKSLCKGPQVFISKRSQVLIKSLVVFVEIKKKTTSSNYKRATSLRLLLTNSWFNNVHTLTILSLFRLFIMQYYMRFI